MFFVAISLRLFLLILLLGFLLALSPVLIVQELTRELPGWLGIPLNIAFTYVLMPVLVSYLHYRKKLSFGGGSLLYWVYLATYAAFTAALYHQWLFGNVKSDTVPGVIVLTAVVGGMVWWAFKTRKLFAEHAEALYEAEREEDISRQVEAIRRAKSD